MMVSLLRKKILIGFSDGYVRKERKEIYYGTVSQNLLNDFENGLDMLGIILKHIFKKNRML